MVQYGFTMSFSSFSISAQFTAQLAMDSCSGAQRISTPIPSVVTLYPDVQGVVSTLLLLFLSSWCSLNCSSVFCYILLLSLPGNFAFSQMFYQFHCWAQLCCARVWHKADAALLPQRSPLQPPLPAAACLHTAEFLTQEETKSKSNGWYSSLRISTMTWKFCLC